MRAQPNFEWVTYVLLFVQCDKKYWLKMHMQNGLLDEGSTQKLVAWPHNMQLRRIYNISKVVVVDVYASPKVNKWGAIFTVAKKLPLHGFEQPGMMCTVCWGKHAHILVVYCLCSSVLYLQWYLQVFGLPCLLEFHKNVCCPWKKHCGEDRRFREWVWHWITVLKYDLLYVLG